LQCDVSVSSSFEDLLRNIGTILGTAVYYEGCINEHKQAVPHSVCVCVCVCVCAERSLEQDQLLNIFIVFYAIHRGSQL
jgi:hypothetical protein